MFHVCMPFAHLCMSRLYVIVYSFRQSSYNVYVYLLVLILLFSFRIQYILAQNA